LPQRGDSWGAGRGLVGHALTCAALRESGIGTIATMPNDTETYPEDSFDNMKAFAERHNFTFPYVIDTTQKVGPCLWCKMHT